LEIRYQKSFLEGLDLGCQIKNILQIEIQLYLVMAMKDTIIKNYMQIKGRYTKF